MAAAVVRSRFGFVAQGLRINAGDEGVLSWREHRRHPRYMEPLVVWDTDRRHRPRKAIWSALVVVGIQSGRIRTTVRET